MKFPPRESRLDVRQRIFLLLISTFSGPPCGEYRDGGSLSTIRIPHRRMIATTYVPRVHGRTYTRVRRVGRRRNETLQSGVPLEYGPCERSKSWPTSLPGFEKLSPRAARAFTREPRAAGLSIGYTDRGSLRSSSLQGG